MNVISPVENQAQAEEVKEVVEETEKGAEVSVSKENPLGLDDETLIKLFETGNVLRRVGFDCERHYGEHDRLPKDIPDLAKRYVEKMRDTIGNDPFAPGKKLRLVPVPNHPKEIQVWSVGPDGDWDGGRQIDSTKKPLDGDIGLICYVDQFNSGGFLADSTISQYLGGIRLAHYLAAKGPKLPKPELKEDGLAWGPVVDGLQLAVELKPKRDFYYLGETIDVRFHLRNAADYAIQVGLTMPSKQDMGEGSVFIFNEKGERLKGQSIWMSGRIRTKQKVLKPGETVSYDSSNLAFVAPGKQPGAGGVGHWVEAGSGVYTVNFKQHFPTNYFRSDARQWNGELETAPVKVRIAKDPKFAIYRVKGYRKPGEKPGTTSHTYFRDDGKPEPFNSLRSKRYPLEDLILDGTPLITEADVVSYDWNHHKIQLTPEARERLAKLKPGVWGIPFLVQSDGKPVYLGAFWSPILSQAPAIPRITMAFWTLKPNTIQIENTQFRKKGELSNDPRVNERLHRALKKTGKLIDQTETKYPWGKAVRQVQTRLRSDTIRDGIPWFYFDLRNDSNKFSVQLGPAGIPTEVLIDSVSYYWSGRIAGKLPICKPGQQVYEARFGLGKDWFTKDKKGKIKQLDLAPGRHTVQVVVYASYSNLPRGHPVKIKILSNPVEIDVIAQPKHKKAAWGKTVDGLQLGIS